MSKINVKSVDSKIDIHNLLKDWIEWCDQDYADKQQRYTDIPDKREILIILSLFIVWSMSFLFLGPNVQSARQNNEK